MFYKHLQKLLDTLFEQIEFISQEIHEGFKEVSEQKTVIQVRKKTLLKTYVKYQDICQLYTSFQRSFFFLEIG